jgi:serine/threonine protein kinase
MNSYAGPEQYPTSGVQTDPRADLYALGAILFQLLTGESPAGKGHLDNGAIQCWPSDRVSPRAGTNESLPVVGSARGQGAPRGRQERACVSPSGSVASCPTVPGRLRDVHIAEINWTQTSNQNGLKSQPPGSIVGVWKQLVALDSGIESARPTRAHCGVFW